MHVIVPAIMTGIMDPIMRAVVPVFIAGFMALFAVADEAVLKCLT